MKKLLALLLALAMIACLFVGCAGDTEKPSDDSKEPASSSDESKSEEPSSEEPTGETYKIALITMDSIDQHWITLKEGAEKAAAELGVELTFMAPNTKDDALQIEQVNNAVSAGNKAIIVAANGPDAISSALKEAEAAGVKIVYVDSPANVEAEATFSTDNTEVLAWAKSNKGFKVGITHLGDDDTIAPAVQKGDTELLNFVNDEIVKLGKDNFFHKDYQETLEPVYGNEVNPDDIVVEGGAV